MVPWSRQFINGLKNDHLRHVLTSIGCNAGGSKPGLQERVARSIVQPRLHHGGEHHSCSIASTPQPTRILSVDMGIKNLAFCVMDVNLPSTAGTEKPTIRIHHWTRLASLPGLETPSAVTDSERPDPYSVPNLSRAAAFLIRSVFLPQKAQVLLIEHQRFRTGGGQAVQQWTLRVNSLEAMLWGGLAALRQMSDASGSAEQLQPAIPEPHAVSPARVARFWFPTLKKVEKKDKVALVRGWLTEGAITGEQIDDEKGIELELAKGLESIKQAYLSSKGVRIRKASSIGGQSDSDITIDGKLDDFADSFLQGAAVVQWELNRQKFLTMDEAEITNHLDQI
jgi:cruciform cutting endonuclease 1